MTGNTTTNGTSSPPSQEDRDELERRAAAIAKATSRLAEQADYLGRIEAVVGQNLPEFITRHPLGEVVDGFVALDDQLTAVQEAVSKLAERVRYGKEVSFPARLDDEEMKSFNAQSGNRVTRTARIYASIISDTTGEIVKRAYEWLRNNELGSLIKETVNSSSLSAAAKELMENGRELPDDLFKLHTKDSVSITRKKGK